MIQPNDLRIFNIVRNVPDDRGISNYLRIHYFLYEDGDECISAEILYKDMQLPAIKLSLDEIEGIPITKKLLVEKCGFSDGLYMHLKLRDDLDICFDTFKSTISVNSADSQYVVALYLYHIKYLHQLQNLIHSLIGNELTIKM